MNDLSWTANIISPLKPIFHLPTWQTYSYSDTPSLCLLSNSQSGQLSIFHVLAYFKTQPLNLQYDAVT